MEIYVDVLKVVTLDTTLDMMSTVTTNILGSVELGKVDSIVSAALLWRD